MIAQQLEEPRLGRWISSAHLAVGRSAGSQKIAGMLGGYLVGSNLFAMKPLAKPSHPLQFAAAGLLGIPLRAQLLGIKAEVRG